MESTNESNHTAFSEEDQESYSTASLAIISLIMGVIIILTIVGNIFVIVAYIRDPRIRTNVGNQLILNLAITDLMVGVFSLTFNLSWLLRGFWPHGEIICKLWLVLDYTVCWVSMITMVLISWDRYCLVSMGLKYKTYQTKKRVGLILILVWVVVLILLSLIAFAWSPITRQYNVDYDQVCVMEFILFHYAPLVVNLIPFAILLIFIITMNTSVYINIYRRSKVRPNSPTTSNVKLATRRLKQDANESLSRPISYEGLASCPGKLGEDKTTKDKVGHTVIQSEEHVSSISETATDMEKESMRLVGHWKAAIVLSILTGCFILFWLPYIITTVVYSICSTECVSNTILEVTEVLAWCNSTINPFIYAATNEKFRKNFRGFLLVDRWACFARN